MRYIDIIESRKNLKDNIINNIDFLNFEPFLHFLKNNNKELYSFYKNVEKEFIDIYDSKSPLIFDISDDKFIFITGVSGSGKSTYSKEYFNSKEFEIIETDKLFNDNVEVSEFQSKSTEHALSMHAQDDQVGRTQRQLYGCESWTVKKAGR